MLSGSTSPKGKRSMNIEFLRVSGISIYRTDSILRVTLDKSLKAER